MAQLHPIDIPDDLYCQLQSLAARQNHSLEVEVIHLLRQSVQAEPADNTQLQLLTELRQGCWQADQPIPDSVALLREIRGYDD